MQYKCQECNDTGGRDKIGAYFDCNACDTAAIRRDLNDFVKSLTQRSTYPTHPEDVALAIHQRALAMAPKQEAPAESLPEMTDDRIFEWAEGYVFTLKGMPHKMTFSRPRFVQAVRTIIAHLPAPVAAPAVANGAMPELPEPYCPEHEDAGAMYPDMFTGYQMLDYARAAVLKERQEIEKIVRMHGISPNPIDDPHPDAELINGALSCVVDAIRNRT